jgi:formylglycine-generating enzyme required for sulfatase activity
MGGNVWEWCQDLYREDAYSGALRGEGMEGVLNAAGSARENRRVMRGGSYHNGLEFLRCAARGHGFERMNAPRVGFRVARNAEAGTR